MVIKEQNFDISILEDFNDSIEQIPVVENSRYQKYLIDLSEVIKYADRNNIPIMECLSNISIIHRIDPDDIGLVLEEEEVILNSPLYEECLDYLQDYSFYIKPFIYTESEISKVLKECESQILNETDAEFYYKSPDEIRNIYTSHGYTRDRAESDVIYSDQTDEAIDKAYDLMNIKGSDGKIDSNSFQAGKDAILYYTELLGNTGHTVRQDMFKVGPQLDIGDYSKEQNQFNKDSIPYEFTKNTTDYLLKWSDKVKAGGTTGDPKRDAFLKSTILRGFLKFQRFILKYLHGYYRSNHDAIDELAEHLRKDEIPRGMIARFIHWLRSLYTKIMFKYKSGISTTNDLNRFNKDMQKITNVDDTKDKELGLLTKLKIAGKGFVHMGKTALKMILGRILFLIDKLLQWLEKTSDKLTDKFRDTFGMSRNEIKGG